MIDAVQPVSADMAIAEGPVETMPTRQSQARIGDRVRCTVNVEPGRGSAIEGVGDLGEAAVQDQVTRDLNRCLRFPSIGAARAFELEASVVGNVNLLIGTVNQEQVGAKGNSS